MEKVNRKKGGGGDDSVIPLTVASGGNLKRVQKLGSLEGKLEGKNNRRGD